MRVIGLVLALGVLLGGSWVSAQEEAASSPPIPLHSIEGTGGVVLTQTAYIVNPPAGDDLFGLPSVSLAYIRASHKHAVMATISESITDRLELSYAFQRVGLEDFETTLDRIGINISDNVKMHVLSARYVVIKEGAFDMDWMPAVTIGVHYKKNEDIGDIDDAVGGALSAVGYEDDDTVEATVTVTKMFADVLPRPFFVSLTARRTDAAQIGWLGFTNDQDIVFEGNVGVFMTERLIVGAEYRQKREQLKKIGKLVREEDDWWSIAASYIVNDQMNITVAYANLGSVINHRESTAWWLQFKYEF